MLNIYQGGASLLENQQQAEFFNKLELYKQSLQIKNLQISEKMKKMEMYLTVLIYLIMIEPALSLGIEVQNTQILGSKDQFRIRLKPTNIQGTYTITYTRKPKDWLATEKYLLVPKMTSSIYNQHLISVVIKDKSKSQYKISLIFIMNSKHMFMDTTIYDYDAQLLLESIVAPIYVTKSQLEILIGKILLESRKNTPPVGFDSFSTLFQSLLTEKQITDAVQTNNIPAIIKLISKVPSNQNINCVQRVAYLSQIASIAHQSIYKKQLKQDQLQQNFIKKYNTTAPPTKPKQVVPDNTNTQQLNAQTQAKIANLRKQATELQRTYMDQIEQLKLSYIQFNSVSTMIDVIKKNITQSNIKLEKTLKDMESNYSKMNQINYLLPTLNPQVQGQLLKIISTLKKAGDSLKKQSDDIRAYLKQQQIVLQRTMDQLDKRRLFSKNMQGSVTKTQQSLSSIYKQLLFLYQPINSDERIPFLIILQNQNSFTLNIKNNAEIDSVLQERRNLIMLNSTIWYLDSVIDKVYFQCYGIQNVNKAQDVDVFVYQISYADFMNYVRKFSIKKDGTGIVPDKQSSIFQTSKVSIQKTNVLSSIWTKRFGQAIQISSLQDQNKQNKSPVNIACYPGESLDSYRGIILQITGNVIQVQMDGLTIYYVLHGACSRIQMADKIPQKGDLIFWRGRQLSRNLFDSFYSLIL